MSDTKFSSSNPTDLDFDLQTSALGERCYVEDVFLSGLKRTNESLVRRELIGLGSASTLQEIKDSLVQVHQSLQTLGIFDAVEITVDKSEKSVDGCVVRIRFEEDNLLGFRSGTFIQGSEGTVEASLNVSNPFGQAEQISLSVEQGTSKTNLSSITLTVPKPLGFPIHGDFRVQQFFTDRSAWSSHVERLRGCKLTVASLTGDQSLSYEWGWHRLTDPSRSASPAVLSKLGDFMRTSLKYTLKKADLDDHTFPRQGWAVRFTSELSNIGTRGFLDFIKNECAGLFALPVGKNAAFHLEWSGGAIFPINKQHKSLLMDRFYLGGISPFGLRGFELRGVGPSDARRVAPQEERERRTRIRDSIGGDYSLSLLAALRFNLPGEISHAAGLRGQLYFNAGNNCSSLAGRNLRNTLSEFAKTMRFSIGCGCIWTIPIGRLEVNISHVLNQNKYDALKPGLQIGFVTSM